MDIPQFAKKFIIDTDQHNITCAITEAEKETSGEIVPMIVESSSTIGHVPLLLFFIQVATFFMLGGKTWQETSFPGSEWLILITIPMFWFIAIALSRLSFIRRVCVSANDRHHQARQRAEVEFYEHGFDKTRDGTGILIFISLMERVVVVLADKNISEKLPDDTWENLVNNLLGEIKADHLGDGIVNAVQECGHLMAEHYPIKEDDTNELKNELIIQK